MRKLKTLQLSIFFVLSAIAGFAQPVFPTSQDNIKENLDQIFEIYGDQITVGYDRIFRFVNDLTADVVAEGCDAPFPQVGEVASNEISFIWNPVSGVKNYEGAFFGLNSNQSEGFRTNEPGITFEGLTGLVLFGFKSICSDGKASVVSIIIADVDMLYPVPPVGVSCECPIVYSYPLFSGIPQGTGYFSIQWTSLCEETKYRVRLLGAQSGDVSAEPWIPGNGDDDGGQKPTKPNLTKPGSTATNQTSPNNQAYYSEISFVHVQTEWPNLVYLLKHCDINAESHAIPFYAGDPGIYSTSFTHSNLTVELFPQEMNGFIVEDLSLDVCACGDERSLDQVDFNQTVLFPNPTNDAFQLFVETGAEAPVTIYVVDLLGNQITAPQEITPNPDGRVELSMQTNNWATGIYNINISSATNNQTIRLSKI